MQLQSCSIRLMLNPGVQGAFIICNMSATFHNMKHACRALAHIAACAAYRTHRSVVRHAATMSSVRAHMLKAPCTHGHFLTAGMSFLHTLARDTIILVSGAYLMMGRCHGKVGGKGWDGMDSRPCCIAPASGCIRLGLALGQVKVSVASLLTVVLGADLMCMSTMWSSMGYCRKTK